MYAGLRSRLLRNELPPEGEESPMEEGTIEEAVDGAVVENVTTVAASTAHFKAVVTRTMVQSALVEFDAAEDADINAIAADLAAQLGDEGWGEMTDGGVVIDRIDTVMSDGTEETVAEEEVVVEGETVADDGTRRRHRRKL